jgi:hypothetical protein
MIPTLSRWLAAALAIGAVAAPVASATDLRSPDARDAARSVQPSSSPIDLRSPDARDAALAGEQSRRSAAASGVERSRPFTDLRSPDARDAAHPRQIVGLPPVEIVRTVEEGGFAWGDAAIGAGLLLALMLMGSAGLLVLRRGPRPRVSTAPR